MTPGAMALAVIPLARELHGQGLDQAHEPGLRRRVMRVLRPSRHRSRDGRCGEEPSEAGALHVRKCRSEAPPNAGQVHLDDFVPGRVVEVRQFHLSRDPGVGDDDMHAAELAHGRRHQGVDIGRPGDIDFRDHHPPARLLRRSAHRFDIVPVRRIPGEREVRARLGEDLRGRRPDAGCGAGDQRYATCETEHLVLLTTFTA